MAKDNLETKAKKAVISMERKVSDIRNVLYDLSAKLCHIIERENHYNRSHEGDHYK